MTNDRIWILLARKLSGEASQTELEELRRLTSQYPQEEQMVSAVAEWWQTDSTADTDFLEATYLAHLERMKDKGFYLADELVKTNRDMSETARVAPRAGSNFPIRAILVAALVTGILILSWLLWKPVPGAATAFAGKKAAEVSTRNGDRSKILLPDGTSVWLNSGSKITYNKDLDNGPLREVYLTGEAFFDVVKNTRRPFVIHTAKMDIKVLGTRFNVKAYLEDKTTETSLIKGSVEVFLKNNPGKKYTLIPNQKLVLLNELPENAAKRVANVALPNTALDVIEIKPLTYLQGTETDIESSWTKNILSFEDESFIEVARKMERWYDVQIEFKNKYWEQQYLKGSFEKESLEQALKALKFTTGFNYKIEGYKISIY